MKKQQREHDAGWLAGRNTSFNAQLGTGTQYPHRDKNSVKTNHRNNSNDLMLHEDLREQLRSALEQLQHRKLSSELQQQKRSLAQQQLKNAKLQVQQLKNQIHQLKQSLHKVNKKYSKLKDKKECSKCKENDELAATLEKERKIYLNDRKILRSEIKDLKQEINSSQVMQQLEKYQALADTLKKETYFSARKIEQQNRLIAFMDEKLTLYELENIKIMDNLGIVQESLTDIEMERTIGRHKEQRSANKQNKSFQEVSRRRRKSGSIKSIQCHHELDNKSPYQDRYQSQYR